MIKPWMFFKPLCWNYWDEVDEATLASDDIFVTIFDGGAAANDIGLGGGLSEVNRTLTQNNGVAAAAGSPPTRELDGVDQFFTITQATLDTLLSNANKTWTVILKVSHVTLDDNDGFVYFGSGGTAQCVARQASAGDLMRLLIEDNNVIEGEETTDPIVITTEHYICLWADGTEVRAGFATSKPTKWSDFDVGKRVEYTTVTGDYTGETWTSNKHIGSTGLSNYSALKLYYLVVAKTCLIEND